MSLILFSPSFILEILSSSKEMFFHLQDGRGLRCGDHLPPHKYIKNTSTCGTTPTEHFMNVGRTPQLTKRKETSHIPGSGKRKKKKQRQRNRDGACTSGRELWRRKSFHTLGSPFTGGDGGGGGCRGGGSFGATETTATGGQRAKRRDSCTEVGCRPALTSLRGLSAHPLGRGELGAEARASEEFRSRERTGVGCVNTAYRGLVCHS